MTPTETFWSFFPSWLAILGTMWLITCFATKWHNWYRSLCNVLAIAASTTIAAVWFPAVWRAGFFGGDVSIVPFEYIELDMQISIALLFVGALLLYETLYMLLYRVAPALASVALGTAVFRYVRAAYEGYRGTPVQNTDDAVK